MPLKKDDLAMIQRYKTKINTEWKLYDKYKESPNANHRMVKGAILAIQKKYKDLEGFLYGVMVDLNEEQQEVQVDEWITYSDEQQEMLAAAWNVYNNMPGVEDQVDPIDSLVNMATNYNAYPGNMKMAMDPFIELQTDFASKKLADDRKETIITSVSPPGSYTAGSVPIFSPPVQSSVINSSSFRQRPRNKGEERIPSFTGDLVKKSNNMDEEADYTGDFMVKKGEKHGKKGDLGLNVRQGDSEKSSSPLEGLPADRQENISLMNTIIATPAFDNNKSGLRGDVMLAVIITLLNNGSNSSLITHRHAMKLGLRGYWVNQVVELAGQKLSAQRVAYYGLVITPAAETFEITVVSLDRISISPGYYSVAKAYEIFPHVEQGALDKPEGDIELFIGADQVRFIPGGGGGTNLVDNLQVFDIKVAPFKVLMGGHPDIIFINPVLSDSTINLRQALLRKVESTPAFILPNPSLSPAARSASNLMPAIAAQEPAKEKENVLLDRKFHENNGGLANFLASIRKLINRIFTVLCGAETRDNSVSLEQGIVEPNPAEDTAVSAQDIPVGEAARLLANTFQLDDNPGHCPPYVNKDIVGQATDYQESERHGERDGRTSCTPSSPPQ